jgi:CheY-like chemotaxis protein
MESHAAEWCQCITRKVSLTCPRCGVCLCKAPESVQRQFWRSAPAWLTEGRIAEQRRRVGSRHGTAQEQTDVLIVDDDEEIRMLAAFSVEQMGYRVAVASGPDEALASIERSAPRLMITDALMPRLDGRQLCKLVKADHPEVKVIIMTSLYTSPRYKHEAYKTFDADGYLAKPVDFGQLREALVKLMPPLPVSA